MSDTKKKSNKAGAFFSRMGGAMRDSGKVTKFKTEHALIVNKISQRKREFGIEIYPDMYPEYDENKVKGKLKVVSVKIQQWERELTALEEKIKSLTYGKEKEGGEEEEDVEKFDGDLKDDDKE
ncbi:hypothetical protein TrST_g1967 [Triparma strigata]|uniref:Uncharacterized protein n=1 Tax=Triparma strigata TaxID=1606541 RepID=A0A9W7EF22_9STRA|nr:hypothetical protein TrST_g1967 [Triparma strigata]